MDDAASRAASVAELPAAALYRTCDPAGLPVTTAGECRSVVDAPGQDRAVEAVRFGLGIHRDGYNIFALGPPGTGRRTVALDFTRARAAGEPTPSDWVYVNNFAEPHKPRALRLPAGLGSQLRADMRNLIGELRVAIPAAFESEDYRARRRAIDGKFKERQEQAFGQVEKEAKRRSVGLVRTPVGMGLAPVRNDQVLTPDEFQKLSTDDQARFQTDMTAVQEQLQATFAQVPQWESERREKIRELNREIVRFAVGHLIAGLKRRHGELSNVLAHLDIVEQDLIENGEQFLAQPAGSENAMEVAMRRGFAEPSPFDRYTVNLLVDRAANSGAPVVEEDHPVLHNLIGRIEHRAQFGALTTDFMQIKPGALHLANGGYLLMDARRLLMQPFAWEEMKRALRAREIRIQSVADMLGILSAATLQPEAIPLDVKVVLTGDRVLYYLLSELDPDFRELFKVAADFDDEVERTPESERAYAALIASLAQREKLHPLDRSATARVIERAARLAGDAERITARIEVVADLLREADHWAREVGHDTIAAADIETAIAAQIRRASRLRERIGSEIARGTILIDTAGARVGQINGLSVLELGGFAFGRPSRITARVRMGKGEVIDIEREVELGGPIHSKGVMILSSFLGARFARRRPLSLSASLVFEQSYGGVEGDSASLAELCAILSALADAPIKQGIAITGSVNQHGEAQAIGGVNEKIEGFFDVCRTAGLTGEQAVIIPAANVKHLMLRRDVVEAVAAGQFHVYAVADVDQALSILTGLEAGARGEAGNFPAASINLRVEQELIALAEQARQFAHPEHAENRHD